MRWNRISIGILALLLLSGWGWCQPAGSKVMVGPSKVFFGPSKAGGSASFNHSPAPVRYQKPMNQPPRGRRGYSSGYYYRYGRGYGYGYADPNYYPENNSPRVRQAPMGEGQAQFKPRRFKPAFQPTKY